MWKTTLSFILLLLLSMPAMAKVYQCTTESGVTFSTIPCDDQNSVSRDGETTNTGVTEKLILPEYPEWPAGWQQTVDYKLRSFSEKEYAPMQHLADELPALVNQQKLSNVANSFSIQDMAISVKDTIQSLCENIELSNANIHNPNPSKVFYGKYSCSARRDTRNGELGVYKIMRGEHSVYVVTVKWNLAPFTVYPGRDPQILENKELKNRFQAAKKYLMEDVRLCRDILCY